MFATPEPVEISSPGTRVDLLLPVRLADPDDELSSVVGGCSIEGVTVDADVSDEAATYNGESFAATRVIKFSVVAVAGLAAQDVYLHFDYVSTAGEALRLQKRTFIRPRLSADEPDQLLPTPE
jgi:hypothetical protein